MKCGESNMAEEQPPIDKLGLGLLIPETTPSDPITGDQVLDVVVPDVELRDAIEKEIYELSIQQAEIEAEHQERLLTVEKKDDFDEEKNERDDAGGGEIEVYNGWRDVEVEVEVETAKGGDDYFGLGKNAESDEGENENGEGDEENGGGQLGEGGKKLGRYNNMNNRRTNYPMRPDAEDCAYYMKFGSCKFGLNCKFNHPLRRKNQVVKEKGKHREENVEKAGQIECKYYMTSGGCKYGKNCKFSHGSDRSSITPNVPEFNFLGLPIRLGEKECPYYMRTGSCKFGSNCRFHHPDPTTVAGGDSQGYGNSGSLPSQLVSSSSVSSWSSPRAFNETSPFVPAMFPPTQGAPTPTPEWNGYQAATYPTSERGLPTPPAFAMNNAPSDLNFPMQHQYDMVIEEYPERPGEPECTFFLKTGDCKFKSNCKFHHPKIRTSKAKTKAISSALNDKGLPLRPDQPICAHYHRYGICKYGPACKYDHPSKFAIMPPPYDQPSFGNSETVDGVDESWKVNETGSSV